jgi:hypothetical protein
MDGRHEKLRQADPMNNETWTMNDEKSECSAQAIGCRGTRLPRALSLLPPVKIVWSVFDEPQKIPGRVLVTA